jgi:8-oxo-dGTP pyrophosphatase MutT (NUDIX family)
MQHTKIISQKTIYKNNFIKLLETELRLPNNKIFIHADIEREPAVSVFPITDTYDLYFVAQYRYMLARVTLEAVAGIIEQGLSPLETAKKELHEEAGISAAEFVPLITVDAAGSFFKTKSHIFVAKDLTFGESSPEDSEEGIKLVKLSLDSALEKIFSGEISTSATVIGVLLLDKMRREGKL